MTGGMRARTVLSVSVAALLIVGTFWGDDDNFPFGPFRMYSTKQNLDGEVRVTEVDGLTQSGEWVGLPFDDFGLRRADVEGQLGTLAQPASTVLTSMAVAYDRFGRGDHEVVALRLRERTIHLENGLAVGEEVVTLATWERD